jgi:LysR family transcriptional regulator, hca operon transcriptional activator
VELRHLRYFIAVAEAGSFRVAAERRLHTSQPSLSRQIRDLEREVGVPLLDRAPRGITLTAAGTAFLAEARRVVANERAAIEAARTAARPPQRRLSVGVVVGHEADCIPLATRLLGDEVRVEVTSGYSVDLAARLQRGTLDLAFMRREPVPGIEYRLLQREEIVAIVGRAHAIAARAVLAPDDLAGERFIGITPVARVLRAVVERHLSRSGLDPQPLHEIDTFPVAIALVGASGGYALLPASVALYLPPDVQARRLAAEAPLIDLVVGWRRDDRSSAVRRFVDRLPLWS